MLWKACLALVAGVMLGISMTHLYKKLKTDWVREGSKVRILCLISVSPSEHDKAQFIQDTWGRRCKILWFMSSQKNSSIPTMALPVREGHHLRYLYEHHLQDVDWVLKAAVDTYVVMENMRYLLSEYDPSDPIYFGHRFRSGGVEWMSGGAGYVMSREAARRMIEEGGCREGGEDTEDILVSECLESVGVRAVDSRAAEGRARFLPSNLREVLSPTHAKDPQTAKYTAGELFDCCSEFMVSTHNVSEQDMYLYEFLIYHLKAYPGTRS